MTDAINYPSPVSTRLHNLDIIRGVALLGILIMNIQGFSMIFAAYSNPTAYGDLTGINFLVYYLSHLFADQKFMTIFSLLFGVGIVLMADNITNKGGRPTKTHLIRMFFLGLFGLAHAYLFWFGDILFTYAVAGFLVYWCRNKSPKFLIIFGVVLIAICSLIMWLAGASIPYWEAADLKAMQDFWAPDAETIQEDLTANLSSWAGQTEARHFLAAKMQSNMVLYLFRVVGVMAIGMALFKMDFFGERFSNKALVSSGIATLVTSVALIAYGNQLNFAAGWPLESMFTGFQYNYWGSLLMAYSYLALLVVFCRSSLLQKLKSLLANVGRMALTNYLSQTLICGFIFYGWGLGLYGSLERSEQIFVVVAVWFIQVVISNIWMRKFKFGPFEWLWRCLTYMQLQPLKK